MCSYILSSQVAKVFSHSNVLLIVRNHSPQTPNKMAVHLNHSHPSYQAVFALDVLTAAAALVLLALATGPTFTRLKSRRFSVPNKSHDTPLKTSLGTYLFLWPGLFCFFLAYTFQFIADILETSGGSSINYNGGLGLHGRLPFSSANGTSNVYTISILSFTTALATIFFSVLINGGVWIYSSHITNNSTGQAAPSLRSKIWNTIILLAILITGFAAWCCGMATRSRLTTWSEIVHMNDATRIIFVLYRCVVIVASVSVSVEVLRRYLTVRANSESNVSQLPLPRTATNRKQPG